MSPAKTRNYVRGALLALELPSQLSIFLDCLGRRPVLNRLILRTTSSNATSILVFGFGLVADGNFDVVLASGTFVLGILSVRSVIAGKIMFLRS